jgi:hypothetical protein
MKKQVLVFQLGMEFGPQDDPLLSERLGLRSIDASSPHIGLAEGHRQQNLQGKKESTCVFIKVGGVKVSKEIRGDQFVPNLKRG